MFYYYNVSLFKSDTILKVYDFQVISPVKSFSCIHIYMYIYIYKHI